MIKKLISASIVLVMLTPVAQAEMLLFVGEGCDYCANLKNYLEENDLYDEFQIEEYEIYNDEVNKAFYLQKSQEVGYTSGGIPLLIDGTIYVEGNNPIQEYLKSLKGLSAQKELSKTTLSEEDANDLSTFLLEQNTKEKQNKELEKVLSQPSFIKPAIDPEKNGSAKDKILNPLGILVILLGLAAFTAILYKTRSRK